MGRPNKSFIAVITPLLQEKYDYACSYKWKKVLGIDAVLAKPARCWNGSVGALKRYRSHHKYLQILSIAQKCNFHKLKM